MKKRIVELTLCALLFLGLSSSSFVYAVMPLPSGTNIYSYLPTALPAVNTDPSQAQPIGVGNVTFTHDLTLQIGLDSFSEPVDIYVALYAPAVFSDMFLFRSDGNLTPLSLEFSPWKAATSGPVNDVLLGTIPLSLIPSGDYTFYLIAAPTGTKAESLADNCYIWGTSVGNLRVLDVSKKAASLFGGDVEGAAAILMALGRNHDIENVAKALLDERLTQYGSILANAAVISMSLFEDNLPSFCEQGASVDGCRQDLLIYLGELHAQLEATELNKDFEKLVSAYTTYLASLGYTAEQIHEAIMGTMLAGDTFIHPFKYEFYIGGPILPFGGIFEYTEADDGGQILKYVTPKGSPASFSDLPQALSLNKTTLSLDSGDIKTVSISGGTGNYTVNTNNSQVATAVISGSSLEVTGLSSGSATITVEDTGGATASVSVTVSSSTTPSYNCGAYVAPGVWKQFNCYNLAAIGMTTGDDPFTPSWRLIGGYWQWGRKGPFFIQWYDNNTEHFAHGPTGPGSNEANEGDISNWDDDYAPDGSWSDSSKTVNDPCPAGFRVPTDSQWNGVIDNNTLSKVGTWDNNETNYSSARFFGDKLMLPAAGYRFHLFSGALYHRGSSGYYWSSSEYGSFNAGNLRFNSSMAETSNYYRRSGHSVRCVAE